MGVLVKMPAPRFDRMVVKTHGPAFILTKCNKCGVRRVGSFADGSLQRWESTHRCQPANVAVMTEKEIC